MLSALIIDADTAAVDAVRGTLGSLGFEFAVVSDEAAALEAIQNHAPDVILLRVELPEVSGFSVCKSLRKNDETRFIPLIVYASEVTDDVFATHRSLKASADEYLRLPFDEEELTELVKDMLSLDEAAIEQSRAEHAAASAADGEASLTLDVQIVDEPAAVNTEDIDVDSLTDDDFSLGDDVEGVPQSEIDALANEDSDAIDLSEFDDVTVAKAAPTEEPAAAPAQSLGGEGEDIRDETEAAFDALMDDDDSAPFDTDLQPEGPSDSDLLGDDDNSFDALADDDSAAFKIDEDAPASEIKSSEPAAGEPEPGAPQNTDPTDSIQSMMEGELDALGDSAAIEIDSGPLKVEDPSAMAAKPLEELSLDDDNDEAVFTDDDEAEDPAAVAEAPEPATASPPAAPEPSPEPAVEASAAAPAGGRANQRELLELKTQLNAKNRELLSLREELEGQERAVLDLKKEQRQLMAKLGAAEERALAAETASLNAQEAEAGRAKSIDALSAELAAAKAQVADLDTAKAKIAELEQAVAGHASRESELQSELVAARKAAEEEVGTVTARVSELETQLRDAKTAASEAEETLASRRDAHARALKAVSVALQILDNGGQDSTEATS